MVPVATATFISLPEFAQSVVLLNGLMKSVQMELKRLI